MDEGINEVLSVEILQECGVLKNNNSYLNLFKTLPGIVAIWGMENKNPLFDNSGNNHSLIKHGTPAFSKTATGGLYLDKIISDYYDSADASWNSPTGALFFAGFVQHDASAIAQETYISKWFTTGNQRSFVFRRDASGKLNFTISVDGTVSWGLTSDSSFTTQWAFVAGRFTPSVGMSIWINTTKKDYTATPPAGIYDSSAAFELGSWIGGSGGMVGNIGSFVMCNSAPLDAQVTALYNRLSRYYTNP